MNRFTVVVLALALAACGDSDSASGSNGGTSTNAQNAQNAQNAAVACGPGTVLADGLCVPASTSEVCADGEVVLDGSCVAAESFCQEGTAYDTATARCVVDETISCGPGTMVDGATGLCVPDASACGPNTEYDADLDQCVPAASVCEVGTFFDDTLKQCRPGRAVYGDCEALVELGGEVSSDTVLPDGGCYSVATDLVLTNDATLTVSRGAVLVFGQGVELDASGGQLLVAGTEQRPVYFTGVSAAPGEWAGIHSSAAGAGALEFTWAVVEYAGAAGRSNRAYGIHVVNGSGIVADNLDVSNSAGWGIYEDDGVFGAMNSVSLRDNASGDVVADPTNFSAFDSSSSFDSDGASYVWPEDITTPVLWDVRANFFFPESIDVTGRFEVAAGSELRFASDAGLFVRGGELNLVGTAQDPIVLRGRDGVSGANTWEGLFIWGSQAANVVTDVVIRGAGQPSAFNRPQTGIWIDESVATLGPVTVEDVDGDGIRSEDSTLTVAGTLTTVNTTNDVFARPNDLAQLGSNLQLGGGSILVGAGVVTDDGTWDPGYPVDVSGIVDIDTSATLTISAGATLQFAELAGIRVDGGLNATGTASDNIVFTATVPAAGNWRGIYFRGSTNPANALVHAVVEYAGSDDWYFPAGTPSLLFDGGASTRLADLMIRDGADAGINDRGGSATDCSNVTITDSPVVTGGSATLAEFCQ